MHAHFCSYNNYEFWRYETMNDTLASMKGEIEELREKIERLEKKVEKLERSVDGLLMLL